MEVEHFITLGVVVIFSLLAAWLVWTCMCKTSEEEDEDVESQQDEEVKSVNSRTKVISTRETNDNNFYSSKEKDANVPTAPVGPANQVLIKPKKGSHKASSYIQTKRENRFHDPYGEWQRREKALDDTEALSGIKTYRKSPVLPHRS